MIGLDHAILSAALTLPIVVFIICFSIFKKKHKRAPSQKEGSTILQHAFEGVLAALFFVVLVLWPEELPKIGEFKMFMAFWAAHTVWRVYKVIDLAIKNPVDDDTTTTE